MNRILRTYVLKTLMLLGLSSVLFSCTYENVEEKYKDYLIECDTDSVTYSSEIQVIVGDNCLMCHSPSGGQLPDLTTIDALRTNETKVRQRINSMTEPMPPTGQMNSCNIDKIDVWYDNGTPP